MARPLEIYLDIETDEFGLLTVVGFRSSETGLIQIVGQDITRRRLLRELPRRGRLYTFNGHAFDLPRIRRCLGLDLAVRLESWDLRWICQRHRLRGGQKAIERRAGFRRETQGMDGWDAVILWQRVRGGDDAALQTLLRYNAEDIEGLRWIKRHLANRDLLSRDQT